MKKIFVFILALMMLGTVSFSQGKWRYNFFTGARDYYVEGLSLSTAAKGDIIYHTGTVWTRLAKGDNGQVLTLAAELPSWAANIGTDELVKVDAGATAGYFGVAGGDGIFRFTANQFTMDDGGNFVTLSLADHATARTAIGLGTANDPTFNDLVVDKLEVNESLTFDAFQTATGDGDTTIDWGLGNHMYFTFGASNEIIRFTAPPGCAHLYIVIKQDGVGSRTIDWSNIANIIWPGDVEPTLSTGVAAVDFIAFMYDGTSWIGLFNGDFR